MEKFSFFTLNIPTIFLALAGLLMHIVVLGIYAAIWAVIATSLGWYIAQRSGAHWLQRMAHNISLPSRFVARDGLRGRAAEHR